MQFYINWLKIDRLRALERGSQKASRKCRESAAKQRKIFPPPVCRNLKKRIAPPSYHEENEWGHL